MTKLKTIKDSLTRGKKNNDGIPFEEKTDCQQEQCEAVIGI